MHFEVLRSWKQSNGVADLLRKIGAMPVGAEMTSIHNGIGRIALDLTVLLSEITGVYRSIIQRILPWSVNTKQGRKSGKRSGIFFMKFVG